MGRSGKAALTGAVTGLCFGAVGKVASRAVTAVKTARSVKKVAKARKPVRVLWSGGQKVMKEAAKFASRSGMKTLEQTTRGKLLQATNNALNKVVGKNRAYNLMKPLWNSASASFVKGARGQVHVFLNSQGISNTSVFYTVEWRILRETGIDVVWHFV